MDFDKIISKLQRTTITKDGVEWLKEALDPFHDTAYVPTGRPDKEERHSIVWKQKSTVTIAAPAAETWSTIIFTLPEERGNSNLTYVGDVTDQYKVVIPASADVMAVGPLCYYSMTDVGAAQQILPSSTAAAYLAIAAAESLNCGVLAQESGTDPSATDVPMRYIGGGFEVTDLTPEIYRQGSVTVGRIPQQVQMNEVILTNGSGTVDHCPTNHECVAVTSNMPPTTATEAVRVPGSATWHAEDGCYCVDTFFDMERPMQTRQTFGARFFNREDEASSGSDTVGFGLAAYDDQTTANHGFYTVCQPNGANTSFAFFSGLNPSSVLRIVCTRLYEMAPMVSDSVLMGLARPSPRYDPLALGVYSLVSQRMPAGVPVGMNAKGDWWKMVAKLISSALPLLSAIPTYGPVVSAVGQGMLVAAPAIAKTVRQVQKAARQNRKKQGKKRSSRRK